VKKEKGKGAVSIVGQEAVDFLLVKVQSEKE
jgi:hypothetical protein